MASALSRFVRSFRKRTLGRRDALTGLGGLPHTLTKYLGDLHGIYLFDVGANQGQFTAAVDRLCGISGGALVELQSEHLHRLESRFPPPRFRVFNVALSDSPGEVEVSINGSDQTTSILPMNRHLPEFREIDVRVVKTLAVKQTTLDHVFNESGLPEVTLLKLDVQGAEHLVLRGGPKTLGKTRMVWTELSYKPLYEGSVTHEVIIRLLEQHGFRLYELEPGFRGPDGELLQSDALFIR